MEKKIKNPVNDSIRDNIVIEMAHTNPPKIPIFLELNFRNRGPFAKPISKIIVENRKK